MLIETINVFKQKFRGLQNLTKFTQKGVMERLEILILWNDDIYVCFTYLIIINKFVFTL